jgi:hypothetical protein
LYRVLECFTSVLVIFGICTYPPRMTIVSTAIGLVVDFRWYIIAALVVVYSAKGYAEYRRLRAFNGPFLAQWTDLWLAKAAFGTNQCGALADVCANYGMHRNSCSSY